MARFRAKESRQKENGARKLAVALQCSNPSALNMARMQLVLGAARVEGRLNGVSFRKLSQRNT